MSDDRRPAGISAVSVLFAFGAFMSGMIMMLQYFSSNAADQTSHAQNASSQWSMLLTAIACLACIAAAYGLWRLMRWGWWTAIVILGLDLVADAISMFSSPDWRTLIQMPIIGVIVWYLLRQRALFQSTHPATALPQS